MTPVDPTAPILAPRASHKVPSEVIKGLLGELRARFYPPSEDPHALKQFCIDRPMLIQAITFPASFLTTKMGHDGCPLAWHQYEEILGIVMATIEKEGDLANVRSFSRYFLHCVQTHMPHNWERYYSMAKRTSHLFDAQILAIAAGGFAVRDTTVQDLAAMHGDLRLKAGRKKAEKKAGAEKPVKEPKAARDSKGSKSRDSEVEKSGIQIELF